MANKIIKALTTTHDVRILKDMKNEMCLDKCKSTQTSLYYCGRCRRLQQYMCKKYHQEKDDELRLRLMYEYLFDFITYEDLKDGNWKKRCKRDAGHHKRIMTLI